MCIDDSDIHLLERVFSIPSGVTRVPVPLEIIDDSIVEWFLDFITIVIVQSPEQRSLFTLGSSASLHVTIKDNDSELAIQACYAGY